MINWFKQLFEEKPTEYRILFCCYVAEDAWYEIDKKIFSKWYRLKSSNADDIGVYETPLEFKSVADAEAYIRRLHKPDETQIKTIEV